MGRRKAGGASPSSFGSTNQSPSIAIKLGTVTPCVQIRAPGARIWRRWSNCTNQTARQAQQQGFAWPAGLDLCIFTAFAFYQPPRTPESMSLLTPHRPRALDAKPILSGGSPPSTGGFSSAFCRKFNCKTLAQVAAEVENVVPILAGVLLPNYLTFVSGMPACGKSICATDLIVKFILVSIRPLGEGVCWSQAWEINRPPHCCGTTATAAPDRRSLDSWCLLMVQGGPVLWGELPANPDARIIVLDYEGFEGGTAQRAEVSPGGRAWRRA